MKITKRNQWETIQYFDEKGNPINFKENEFKTIKFPDGVTEIVILKTKKKNITYYDHGMQCTTEQVQFGFYCEVHGIQVWIDIDGVELV